MDQRPVGIFDSGVGGLSIVREMRTALPAESILYVADSANAPWGDKPPEFVRDLKSLGYDHVPVDDLVSMRIHGATPEFVRDLKSLGYDHIPVDSLVSMRIHGVSPEFVRRVQASRGSISIDRLVSMRIHGEER